MAIARPLGSTMARRRCSSHQAAEGVVGYADNTSSSATVVIATIQMQRLAIVILQNQLADAHRVAGLAADLTNRTTVPMRARKTALEINMRKATQVQLAGAVGGERMPAAVALAGARLM